MVQRLSLYGQLTESELPLAKQCVEALCGMPARVFRQHRRTFKPCVSGDLYKLSLVSTNGEVFLEGSGLPEVGQAIKVVSQAVFSGRILEGTYDAFISELGYEFDCACCLVGYEFVHDKTAVLRIYKVLDENEQPVEKISSQYVVMLYVDVASVTDLAAVEKATQQILHTQQELKNVISFRMPQRQAFNTKMPR